MPIENFEEEGLERIPNLCLAQQIHLGNQTTDENLKKEIFTDVLNTIKKECMAPYLEYLLERCLIPKYMIPDDLIESLKKENAIVIEEKDAKINDCEKNQGDIEIRDAILSKAHYLSKIGAKEAALNQFRLLNEKTLMIGYRLDMIFHIIRIGYFFNDRDLIENSINKANTLIEEGGDWDRRNRLKVYRGLALMKRRDFAGASSLLLEAVATFTSYELMSYENFVFYTVLCSLVSLDRVQFKSKIIRGSEIQEILFSYPNVKELLVSFYECQYQRFFVCLASLEKFLYNDVHLHIHTRFFIREMRVRAYEQQLEPYSSLSMASMAESFGVSQEFIDQELSRFIAAGRLLCKIDKVNGVVVTARPDSINHHYQNLIKQGDILLNRVQKLSRVINI